MNKSEQARADAIADAETLLSNAPALMAERLMAGAENRADHQALYALYWDLNALAVGLPAEMAEAAARAAFRAVPGLKGE